MSDPYGRASSPGVVSTPTPVEALRAALAEALDLYNVQEPHIINRVMRVLESHNVPRAMARDAAIEAEGDVWVPMSPDAPQDAVRLKAIEHSIFRRLRAVGVSQADQGEQR